MEHDNLRSLVTQLSKSVGTAATGRESMCLTVKSLFACGEGVLMCKLNIRLKSTSHMMGSDKICY